MSYWLTYGSRHGQTDNKWNEEIRTTNNKKSNTTTNQTTEGKQNQIIPLDDSTTTVRPHTRSTCVATTTSATRP